MAWSWAHTLFFPSTENSFLIHSLPTAAASLAANWQRIGPVKLRLAPPASIQSWKDIIYIFFNHEFLRVLVGVAWLIVCGLVETFLAELSDMRYSSTLQPKYPLGDLAFDAFPFIKNFQIVNYLMAATVIYTLVMFILQSPDWTTRWIMLRRWLFIMGTLYVFRGMTLVVTQLPSPLYNNCQVDPISINGNAAERFGFLFSIMGGSGMTCTDNIFSGHTSLMMSCVMVWRIHSRVRRIFNWIAYAIVLSAILMILFTHFHYSIDVLLAIYIVYTTWNIYMQYIQECSLHYMFGFTHNTTLDVFKSRMSAEKANHVYEYLTWQPHPLGTQWLMWFCMYADGLDIRLRALGIFDERGSWVDCKKYNQSYDLPMNQVDVERR
ncbi:hypothetical protein BDF14DRAFT_1985821 [Spinellus fusiger]|nr:hypothetical protein BDF14DRAFT_1985821 [Spinellus fusiger]